MLSPEDKNAVKQRRSFLKNATLGAAAGGAPHHCVACHANAARRCGFRPANVHASRVARAMKRGAPLILTCRKPAPIKAWRGCRVSAQGRPGNTWHATCMVEA
ncbi:twin-arginine translocation signal domain-containing protein [Orrella dioscoreae]|uniref:twin-arginine translocation signal domain-containing protein n=1 Tax=Orrella dioscoreae TaxID=1851544 RepID=UPI0013001581